MAAARTKITREPPVRTGPIRQPARLGTAERLVTTTDGALRNVVERSVDTAYRVIDEYMERGRAAARLQTERSDGRNGMSTDPRYTTPYTATSDLMAPWVEMMRMWADGMAAFVPGGQSAVNAWMNTFAPFGTAWAGMAMDTKVEVRVSSKQLVAINVDLTPGAEALALKAEPVMEKAKASASSPVTVTLESSRGLVRVTVSVPDDQPKGSQSFTILDAYNQHRGTLQVDVLPET